MSFSLKEFTQKLNDEKKKDFFSSEGEVILVSSFFSCQLFDGA